MSLGSALVQQVGSRPVAKSRQADRMQLVRSITRPVVRTAAERYPEAPKANDRFRANSEEDSFRCSDEQLFIAAIMVAAEIQASWDDELDSPEAAKPHC